MAASTKKKSRAREDYGFFGPGSATWKVWTYPTSLIAFQRAVTIETLDPALTAAVVKLNGVRTNPRKRFDRTAGYFMTIAVGDGRAAVEASSRLMKVHDRAVGIEPLSGLAYSANDPDSQLWIHVTAWHSILICYERYGPGKLEPEVEAEYWAQCAVAAELQTIDIAKVPRSRDEVRAYFAEMRPKLALSESGRDLFHYLLRPSLRNDARLLSMSFRLSSFATIATMPKWMRQLAGVDQNRLIDAATLPLVRAAVISSLPLVARLRALSTLAPSAKPLLEAALRNELPRVPETVTPSQVRERLGLPATSVSATATV